MTRSRTTLLKLFFSLLVALALLAVWLDARITATFTDKMWELPAKVYARPLELFAGAQLAPADLAYELAVLGYRRVETPSAPGQLSSYRNRFDIYTRGFAFPGG